MIRFDRSCCLFASFSSSRMRLCIRRRPVPSTFVVDPKPSPFSSAPVADPVSSRTGFVSFPFPPMDPFGFDWTIDPVERDEGWRS